MYKVQVIMSTYNGEKYLKEQIKSIFVQQECKISLLIRDDGSTDGTIKIINELSKEYNINLIQGDNLKPAKSFLTALQASDTNQEFYAFADQDDVWKSDKLINAINKISTENKKIPILYTGNLCPVDKDLNILNNSLLPESIITDYKIIIARSSQLFGCTMVFNKSLRDYVCEHEFNKPIMHDLWIGLLASLKGKIIYDSVPYIYYRQHGNNQVGSQLSFKEKMKNRILFLKGHDRGNIANQAKDILKIINDDLEISSDIKEYTKMVANYNISIKNKLYYLKNVRKDDLNFKKWIFHVILILLGNL